MTNITRSKILNKTYISNKDKFASERGLNEQVNTSNRAPEAYKIEHLCPGISEAIIRLAFSSQFTHRLILNLKSCSFIFLNDCLYHSTLHQS